MDSKYEQVPSEQISNCGNVLLGRVKKFLLETETSMQASGPQWLLAEFNTELYVNVDIAFEDSKY